MSNFEWQTFEFTDQDLIAVIKSMGGTVHFNEEKHLAIGTIPAHEGSDQYMVCMGDFYKDARRNNHAVALDLGLELIRRQVETLKQEPPHGK